MNELNGIFMFIKSADTNTFKVDLQKHPEKYFDKIIFIEQTKEIITHGTTFQAVQN